jgi:hypothetical protein
MFARKANGNPAGASGKFPSRAEPHNERGRMIAFQGRVEAIEPVADPLAGPGTMYPWSAEPLWRCTIVREGQPHRVLIYTAEMQETLRSRGAGRKVAVDAVFVKYVPGARDEPMPVVVVPRFSRHADGPLGSLGMDLESLDGVLDNAPLTTADSEAFYRLLELTKNASSARLTRQADVLDAAVAASLFHDPAAERGRLIHVTGIARGVSSVPIDDPALAARLGRDHYFQIDLVIDALQDNPLVFCTLDLPKGLPLGGRHPEGACYYGQPIEATGFFLKNWQYPTGMTAGERAAHPSASRALQTAPLVIGPAPVWKPVPIVQKGSAAAVGILALAMIGLGLLLWSVRQSDREFSFRSHL